jgi:hypothetical protein
MDKIFSINKWSLALCVCIIAIFLAVQAAGNAHLAASASLAAEHIFSWDWLELGRSHGVIDKLEVVKRTETDAIVRVLVREQIEQRQAGNLIAKRPEINARALLTFYRSDKDWILAKVEFQ